MVKLTSRMKMVLKWLGLSALSILGIYLFITKIFKYAAPFILAFLIMISIEKPVGFLQRKLKFSRGLSVVLSLTAFLAIAGGGLFLVFYRIINELWRLALEIPRIDFNPIMDYFESLLARGQDLFLSLPDSLAQTIEQSLELDVPRLSKIATTISSRLMGIVMGMVEFLRFLPQLVVFVIVVVISAYFMSRDRHEISQFLSSRIPKSWFDKIRSLRDDMLLALAGYIKAQFILMIITFLELFVGFQIIGVKYAFFFALVTALVDILPVLGTGTILIPTSLAYMIIGNVPKGLAFLSLYLVIFVVRQFLEPKVLSQSLGLHPLATLISMYIGLKFMGVLGMILGPITIIILKALHKAGILPSWKT